MSCLIQTSDTFAWLQLSLERLKLPGMQGQADYGPINKLACELVKAGRRQYIATSRAVDHALL